MLPIYVSKNLRVKSEVGLVVLDVRVHQVCPHDSPRRGCVGALVDGPMSVRKRLPCGFWVGGRGAHPPRPRRRRGCGRHLTSNHAAHGHLCRKGRSPLATLVHQGSDPTLPHQALGDPTERHAFLEGVKAPRGHEALFGPSGRRGQVGSVSPDGLDSTMVTPSRSKSSGRMALSGRGPVRRRPKFGGGAAAGDGGAVGRPGPGLRACRSGAVEPRGRPGRGGRRDRRGEAWSRWASAAYSARGIAAIASRKSRNTCSIGVSCAR